MILTQGYLWAACPSTSKPSGALFGIEDPWWEVSTVSPPRCVHSNAYSPHLSEEPLLKLAKSSDKLEHSFTWCGLDLTWPANLAPYRLQVSHFWCAKRGRVHTTVTVNFARWEYSIMNRLILRLCTGLLGLSRVKRNYSNMLWRENVQMQCHIHSQTEKLALIFFLDFACCCSFMMFIFYIIEMVFIFIFVCNFIVQWNNECKVQSIFYYLCLVVHLGVRLDLILIAWL